MIYLDIETLPEQPEAEAKVLIAETIKAPGTMKKAETIADWHNGEGKYAGEKEKLIEETYRKTSFDGGKGQICSIAWAIGDGDASSISILGKSEREILNSFFGHLSKETASSYFIGHNIRFDLKFLFHRCVINQVDSKGFKLPFSGRHEKHFYCTSEAWAGFNQRISQDNLCKALGIPGKPDDIDGSKVWDHFKEGKIARIEEYNRYDVETVQKVYKRLNFI